VVRRPDAGVALRGVYIDLNALWLTWVNDTKPS
jgi:hypothetical protein